MNTNEVRSMIVSFIGPIGSGKTTAAQALIGDGFEPVNFADPLRRAMEILNPIVGTQFVAYNDAVGQLGYRGAKDKYPEMRALMQRFGTELARAEWGADFWVNQWCKASANHCDVVVDDMRFPNEYDAVARHQDSIILRIYRPGFDDLPSTHESEQHWSRFEYDSIVFNGGSIEDLHREVLQVLWDVEERRADEFLGSTSRGRDITEQTAIHHNHPFYD